MMVFRRGLERARDILASGPPPTAEILSGQPDGTLAGGLGEASQAGRPQDRPAQGGRDPSGAARRPVAVALAEHLRSWPVDGDGLVLTSRKHKPLNRNYFNSHLWRPALLTAGVQPGRGNPIHALRHFYASVLIDAGESVKAVAEYLDHADPGFTLRVYAHLFPASEDRARKAVEAAFSAALREPPAARQDRRT